MATAFEKDRRQRRSAAIERHDRPRRRVPGPDARPTVLIVEDEPHLRLLYETELRREGFHTLCANDGQSCLDNLLAMDVDLVVLDLRMPGMDGLDLLARIRGHDRTIPVIINTAYSSYANNYLTWSADAFLVKSSDVAELVDRARELARR